MVRLPPELYEQLKERALARDLTTAQAMRRAVRAYVFMLDGQAPDRIDAALNAMLSGLDLGLISDETRQRERLMVGEMLVAADMYTFCEPVTTDKERDKT